MLSGYSVAALCASGGGIGRAYFLRVARPQSFTHRKNHSAHELTALIKAAFARDTVTPELGSIALQIWREARHLGDLQGVGVAVNFVSHKAKTEQATFTRRPARSFEV